METLQYYLSHDDYCFVCLNCSSDAPLLPCPSNIAEFFAGIMMNIMTPWMCCSCASVVQAYHELRERAQRAQTLLSTVMFNLQLVQKNKEFFTAEFSYIKYNTKKPPLDQRPAELLKKSEQVEIEVTENVDLFANAVPAVKDEIESALEDPCAEIQAHRIVRAAALPFGVDSIKRENAFTDGMHNDHQYTSSYSQPRIPRIAAPKVSYFQHKKITPKHVNPKQSMVILTQPRPKRSEIFHKGHPLRIRETDTDVTFDENDEVYMRMNDLLYEKILNNKISDEEYRQRVARTLQSEEYIKSDKKKCDQCAITFAKAGLAYNQHMKRHVEVTPNRCRLCSQYVESPERLESHIMNHLNQYVCLLCGEAAVSRAPMITHYFTKHTQIKFHCKHCSEPVFKEPIALIKHIDVWHKYQECTICHKLISRRRLQQHEASHKASLLKEVFCNVCDLRLSNRASLTSHMKVVHSERSKKEECVTCHKMVRQIYMAKHIAKHEAKLKPSNIEEEDNAKVFVCNICNKTLKSERALDKHNRKHAFQKKCKWECDDCKTIFAQKNQMRSHILRVHLKLLNFKCSECPQAFPVANELRKHARRSHSKKPLPKTKMCDICGKSFTAKKILEAHRLIHTGEKPHSCEQCGRAFRQECALKTHVKLVHLGIKYKDMLESRKKRKLEKTVKALGTDNPNPLQMT